MNWQMIVHCFELRLCAMIWYVGELGIDIARMNTNGNSNKDVLTSILGKVMKEVISITICKKGYNIRYKDCGVDI